MKNENLVQLVSSLTHFSEFIDYEMSRATAYKPLIILNLESQCNCDGNCYLYRSCAKAQLNLIRMKAELRKTRKISVSCELKYVRYKPFAKYVNTVYELTCELTN